MVPICEVVTPPFPPLPLVARAADADARRRRIAKSAETGVRSADLRL